VFPLGAHRAQHAVGHVVIGALRAAGMIRPRHTRTVRGGPARPVTLLLSPAAAVEAARCELATEFLEDLRRIDAQIREAKKKHTAAVRASATTLTEVFGVGPIVAATVIGEVRDVSRFADRDHFAACNGTAPIEVSSGRRKIYRLSRRGNRRLHHVIHMAAVTQISHRHSPGRAYYQRKLTEGKTPKEALRSLKRRLSDVIFAQLQADARRAASEPR
jgi:transposase